MTSPLRRSSLPLAAVLSAALFAAAFAAAPVTAQDRSPGRPSLLSLAQPLWSDLSPAQQQILKPFEDQWNALPVTEKRAWVRLADRVPAMQGDERKRAQRRIRDWAALTPDQRRLARANYRMAQRLPDLDRAAEWENYQTMTPEQRAVLRSAGATSNTAARHAGARTGLAKQAQQPLPRKNPDRQGATATTQHLAPPAQRR
jgi:hypothetical protein